MRRPPLPGPLLPGLLLPGLLLLAAAAPPVRGGELEDSTFVATVAHPAFTDRHPVVMIDEAHHDYFTMGGRYRALAGLLASDGLLVVPGRQPFTPRSLDSCQVLVVADAAGAADVTGKAAARPAFLAGECDAVRDWVRRGGALLLIADHYPFGSAMDSLGLRFGVQMGKSATMDAREADPEVADVGCLIFTRARRLLGDHPILRGRGSEERIDRVGTFTGQSLKGPPGSKGLLVLSSTAADIPLSPDARRTVDPGSPKPGAIMKEMLDHGGVPAVGRYQGLAFTFGRGRVVVLGEGALFGAQLWVGWEAARAGKDVLVLGMNRKGLDNRQFALNVVHWLTKVLR
jgi:hypothetical protein